MKDEIEDNPFPAIPVPLVLFLLICTMCAFLWVGYRSGKLDTTIKYEHKIDSIISKCK